MFNFGSWCTPAVGAVVLVLAAPTSAHAPNSVEDQVWNGTSAGYSCQYAADFSNGEYLHRVSISFTPTRTGRLSTFRIGMLPPVDGMSGGSAAPSGQYVATLHRDAGGSPGAVVDESVMSVADIAAQPHDAESSSSSARDVTIRMDAPAVSAGTPYWLTLAPRASSSTCFWLQTVQPGPSTPAQTAVAYRGDGFGPFDPAKANGSVWRLHQSVVIPAQSSLSADPYLSQGTVLPSVNGYRATLTSAGTPVGGKQIVFSSGGSTACTATTSASGVASCPVGTPVPGTGGYTAAFAGDADFLPSSSTAPLVG